MLSRVSSLGLKGIDAARPYYIQFKMTCSEQEFFDCLAGLADEPFDPEDPDTYFEEVER